MQTATINHAILITDGARGFIDDAEFPRYRVERLEDPAGLPGEASPGDGALLLVIMHTGDAISPAAIESALGHADACYKIILTGTEEDLSRTDESDRRRIMHFLTRPAGAAESSFLIQKAFSIMEGEQWFRAERAQYLETLTDMRQDQEDLITIGRSLSTEKDPDRLLRSILMLSKKITGADAGSIFVVEEGESQGKQLRFKYSHTFSKNLPYEEFVLAMNKNSIAGYVAVTGNTLNIPDVYKLSKSDPVTFNSSFDKVHNYRSKSMLVIPMRNHVDEIIGVIQLINSKEYANSTKMTGNEAFEVLLSTPEDFDVKVVAFSPRYEKLMEAVASQAAIAIENNRMLKQIQTQFEEFVKASVMAIESRDVATSGHSFRVAEFCKEMAYAINSETQGVFADVKFSESAIKEIEFAALLHDFGKVYIDLAIFQKAKKLFPKELENLVLKMDYLYRYTEMQYSMREGALLADALARGGPPEGIDALRERRGTDLARILGVKDRLIRLNEPTVTDEDPAVVLKQILAEIESIECRHPDGSPLPILSDHEKTNLSIRRGSLNPDERKEIESHVTHTYNFVSRIPWPPEYRNIPEIAAKHHEMLDGTGYPSGLKGADSIPLQARIMAIADIYDALSATDRPYKKAVPLEKTLSIMQADATRNKLDAALVELMIRYHIYEKIHKDLFRQAE
ncbi:MAG: GAF domain-containing protein [Spirochaetes bacterium]|nr:MAG: GAF domain-containing protein [Spirochaetota bacterium]